MKLCGKLCVFDDTPDNIQKISKFPIIRGNGAGHYSSHRITQTLPACFTPAHDPENGSCPFHSFEKLNWLGLNDSSCQI